MTKRLKILAISLSIALISSVFCASAVLADDGHCNLGPQDQSNGNAWSWTVDLHGIGCLQNGFGK